MQGISLSTTVFGPRGMEVLPLPQALRQASEAGYRRIEISRKHHHMTQQAGLIEELGLSVWAVHGTLVEGHAQDEGRRRAAIAAEEERMRDASRFAPCPYVVHYTSRSHDPGVAEAYRKSIADIVPIAEKYNLTLAIETVCDMPSNERYPDSREISALVRSFRLPLVNMCLDINHSNVGENLDDVIRNCDGLIATIHVSDNMGAYEDHLPPGQGIIDFPPVLRAVAAAGYKGPINLEFHLPGYPTREELVSARRWSERMLAVLSG